MHVRYIFRSFSNYLMGVLNQPTSVWGHCLTNSSEDLLKKHAQAKAQDEEVEQAERLSSPSSTKQWLKEFVC
jgi:hypothetical protein